MFSVSFINRLLVAAKWVGWLMVIHIWWHLFQVTLWRTHRALHSRHYCFLILFTVVFNTNKIWDKKKAIFEEQMFPFLSKNKTTKIWSDYLGRPALSTCVLAYIIVASCLYILYFLFTSDLCLKSNLLSFWYESSMCSWPLPLLRAVSHSAISYSYNLRNCFFPRLINKTRFNRLFYYKMIQPKFGTRVMPIGHAGNTG